MLLIAAVIAGLAIPAFSQPSDPQTDPDNPVPISGLEILLISGGALGIKKLWDSRKNRQSEN